MATGGGDAVSASQAVMFNQENPLRRVTRGEDEVGEEDKEELLDVSKSSEDELYATMKKKDIVTFAKVAKEVIEEYIDFTAARREGEGTPRLTAQGSRVGDGSLSPRIHDEPVSRIHTYLSRIQGALEVAVKFLEDPDNGKLRQHEGALRGLLKLAEIGAFVVSCGILYLASELLEVRKEDYQPQLDFINQCLQDVRNKEDKIGLLVEQAAKFLTEIIVEPEFSHEIARKFDDCIHQSRSEIQQCENTLAEANRLLKDTVNRLQGRRWAFVGVKVLCLSGMCYGVYKLYKSGTVPMSVAAVTAGAILTGGIAWNLPQAQDVYTNLVKLQMDLSHLQLKLKNMTVSVQNSAERMSRHRRQMGYDTPLYQKNRVL